MHGAQWIGPLRGDAAQFHDRHRWHELTTSAANIPNLARDPDDVSEPFQQSGEGHPHPPVLSPDAVIDF